MAGGTIKAERVEQPDGSPVILSGQLSPKAIANLNGTGTISLRGSFNISSVVDNGTGDYTFNFTNIFTNTDYTAVSSGDTASTGLGGSASASNISYLRTAGAEEVKTHDGNTAFEDALVVDFIAVGDLA